MNDFLDALKARLRSPLLGYWLLAGLAINWRVIFYLLVDNGTAVSRIEYFDSHTNFWRLLIVPGLVAIVIVVANPWVAYLLSLVSAKPQHLHAVLSARSEHQILIARKELEDARAGLLASAESELIERARRDQEVDRLESQQLRDHLRVELEKLREEREALRGASQTRATVDVGPEAAELLHAAADGDGTVMMMRYSEGLEIQSGGKTFSTDGARRTEARWEAAVDELRKLHLMEDRNGKGEVFFLTDRGYKVADELRKR